LVQGATQVGSPLYEAGVDGGDRIARIGAHAITSDTAWRAMLAAHKPGDTAPITFVQRGVERTATLHFGADPRLVVAPMENPTPAQMRVREGWLSSRPRP